MSWETPDRNPEVAQFRHRTLDSNLQRSFSKLTQDAAELRPPHPGQQPPQPAAPQTSPMKSQNLYSLRALWRNTLSLPTRIKGILLPVATSLQLESPTDS